MKITVVGIGNAGTTIAADLSEKGHSVTLLKTSNRLHNDNYEFIKNNKTITVEDLDKKYVATVDNVTTDYILGLTDDPK